MEHPFIHFVPIRADKILVLFKNPSLRINNFLPCEDAMLFVIPAVISCILVLSNVV